MEKYIVKENEILIEILKKMFSNLSKNSGCILTKQLNFAKII